MTDDGVVADLFAATDKSVEQVHQDQPPEIRALRAIEKVLISGAPCLLAFSSGKDSSALANLMLNAAVNIIAQGYTCPPILVSHSETGIDNPEVVALASGELAKIQAFAERYAIPLQVKIGRPTLSACFATRIIGGRALPPFPSTGRRDCAMDWKVAPSVKTIRQFVKTQRAEDNHSDVVVMTGTRSSESQARAINTASRGEAAHQLWYSPEGEPRLSPILDWSTDDVWTYLGEAAAGFHLAYSDFSEVLSFYKASGGSSCAVVGDMKMLGKGKPCGARGGCHQCVAVARDHSVENMIAEDPEKYAYLVPLNELRTFIAETQWDWSRRNFLTRTINSEGRIKVQADQYSPAMTEELLWYSLAAQDRANELGAPSHVEIVGLRELFAIDWYWSVRAWHPPYHALHIYLEHCAGRRRYAPKIERPHPPSPPPVLGDIHVGTDWDEHWSALYPAGLRNPAWELFSESCGPSLRENKDGKVFLDLDEGPEFDVDLEGAELFLSFIAPERIAACHRHDYPDWTEAAATYLQYGTVTLGSGSSSMVDSTIRRSQWLQQHGLHGHQTPETLRTRLDTAIKQQADLFA